MAFSTVAMLPVTYDQPGSATTSFENHSPRSVTQKDALRFEETFLHTVSPATQGFPVDDFMAVAAQAEAAGYGDEVAESDRKRKTKKIPTVVLGDAVLHGLNHTSKRLQNAYHTIYDLMNEKHVLSPFDLLKMQVLLLDATVAVDFATRVLSKVATSVDSLLRLQ